MDLHLLTAADVKAALPMAEAIGGMKYAFAQLSTGRANAPLRTHLDIDGSATLVMLAYLAEHANTAVVLPRLREQGFDIDAVDSQGRTPLVFAIQSDEVDRVQRLIDAGADINRKIGDEGWTPLMFAVMADDKAIVKHLLEAGADIDAANTYGFTAAILAAQLGKEDLTRMLTRAGGV